MLLRNWPQWLAKGRFTSEPGLGPSSSKPFPKRLLCLTQSRDMCRARSCSTKRIHAKCPSAPHLIRQISPTFPLTPSKWFCRWHHGGRQTRTRRRSRVRTCARERGQLPSLQPRASGLERKKTTELINLLLFCWDQLKEVDIKTRRELTRREKARLPASCVVQIQIALGKKTKPKAKTSPARSSTLTSSFAFPQKNAAVQRLKALRAHTHP